MEPGKAGNDENKPDTSGSQDQPIDAAEREANLRKELEGVRSINESIEGLLATLRRTNTNMESVSQTVTNASALLNTWTRILSQTEHNQRLILDPTWKGATEDQAQQEAEAREMQQAAERKAVEEEQRREALRLQREEEENRRRLGTAVPARGVRGTSRARGAASRGRSIPRSAATANYRSYASRSDAGRARPGSGRSIPGTTRGSGIGRARSRTAR